MIKNKIKVNNPLTVIAIFSMLTEASAAVSLPYINSEHQKIYVWFLIIFPSFLITLFFLTLNFNNKTLYTPADFSKADHTSATTAHIPLPHAEPSHAFKHTATPLPLSAQGYHFDTKLSSYNPQRFIFLPQGHRVYDADPAVPPAPNKPSSACTTESFVLVEGKKLTNLHFIDLGHPSLQRPNKQTIENALYAHFQKAPHNKTTRSKNDVLLLLVTTQLHLPLKTLKHSIRNVFNTPAQVIIYNTDTHTLDTLNSL